MFTEQEVVEASYQQPDWFDPYPEDDIIGYGDMNYWPSKEDEQWIIEQYYSMQEYQDDRYMGEQED